MRNGEISLAQAAQCCGGTVAAEYAEKTFRGANFDTRRLQRGELFVAITGARDGHDFAADALQKGAAAVLASKPLAAEIPAIYVKDTVAALQAIAAAYRKSLPLKSVGITGSVGKTTTKEMIAAVLETTYRTEKTAANFNNGLGLPVTVLGLQPDCDVRAEDIRMSEDGIRFTAAAGELRFPVELPVVGRHNVLNALAAIAVGLELHVPVAGIQAGLAGFHNTGMRQKIYPLRGMTVIEDCYNAGPESMRAALQVLKDTKAAGRHIAVLGGMLELGDHAPLAHYEVGKAAAQCADLLFAYGAHAEEYVRGAEEAGIPAQLYPTHEAISEALCRTAKPGDVLLVKGSRGMRMERVLELLGND